MQFVNQLKLDLSVLKYKVEHKLFQWKADRDGDVSLVIGGVVALTKYKEHTMVSFPWEKDFPRQEAGKWQGHDRTMRESER